MKNDMWRMLITIALALLAAGGFSYSLYLNDQNAGASLDIPTPIALFETSLASNISSTATSMTLTSATDKAGTTLASSTYAFIIDEGTASEEMVLADCTGTACANMIRGISIVTGTTSVTALQFSHRRGASVKITDGPQLLILSRLSNGIAGYPNLMSYKSGTVCDSGSDGSKICDINYIRNIAGAGAATSTESKGGLVELATALEQASSTYNGVDQPTVLQSRYATSSPGGTAAALYTLILDNAGKIASAAINVAVDYTWSVLQTFNAGITVNNATTTISATSTIAANTNNPLYLNGIDYAFSGTEGASSTVLSTNGSGALSWASISSLVTGGRLLAATTTDETVTNTTSETTLGTGDLGTLPANTIGTNGVITGRMYVSQYQDTGATSDLTVRVKMGVTTICSLVLTAAPNSTNPQSVEWTIFSDGSASAQRCITEVNDNNESFSYGESTSSVDTTSAQTISVTAQWGANDVDTETFVMSSIVFTFLGSSQ